MSASASRTDSSRGELSKAATCRRSPKRCSRGEHRPIRRSPRQTPLQLRGMLFHTNALRLQRVLSSAHSTHASTRARKLLEFVVSPISSTARSRRRVRRRFSVRKAQRLLRSGRAAAAARSTGLRPVHLIAAAVTNRGPNLLGGIRNHYKLVMLGKPKFLPGNLHSLCAF